MGALRLALAMLGPQTAINLRRADAGDEALLLRWANDPQVRASSFSPDLIAPSDHHNWFRQGLTDPNRQLLIAAAADGCPLGQIRFDRQPLPRQDGSAEASVDLSLDRCARGFGLAADLVRLGLQVMEQTWGPGIEAVAEVQTTNAASNACFSRAGFVQESISPVPPPSRAVNRWRCCPAASHSSAIAAAGSIATCQS
jgi:RimJ/RimL family protein N-acetyltransferase